MNVAFVIYRRPELTRKVFAAIRKAQPERLFVIADGPRSLEENDVCKATRELTESVDWECKVERNYAFANIGCRERVITGLDWVFEHVEDAIILEDDCFPSDSFFRYAQELLERYKDSSQVGYISGVNFAGIPNDVSGDYWLSKYGGIWGWATWKRAWTLYDRDMSDWTVSGRKWADSYFRRRWVAAFWQNIYDLCIANGHGTWDYNWVYTLQRRDLYVIVPRKNLTLNIGFGADATHTNDLPSFYRKVTSEEMTFPLSHPERLYHSESFDRRFERRFVGGTIIQRCKRRAMNRYLYGAMLRRIPLIGPLWALLRRRSASEQPFCSKDQKN